MAHTTDEQIPPAPPDQTPEHIMGTLVGNVLGLRAIMIGLTRAVVRTPAERDQLAQTMAALFEETTRQLRIYDAPFPDDLPGLQDGLDVVRAQLFEALRRPLPPFHRRVLHRIGWPWRERSRP